MTDQPNKGSTSTGSSSSQKPAGQTTQGTASAQKPSQQSSGTMQSSHSSGGSSSSSSPSNTGSISGAGSAHGSSSQSAPSGQGSSSQGSSSHGTSSYGTSSQGSSSQGATSSQGIADKATSTGRDLKSTATDLASSSADAIKGQAAGLVDAAKNAASMAGERLQKEVDTRKNAGARYIGNLADTLKRAAGEFDSDLPIAATYIRRAAEQVENVSDTIENGNINDLVRGAQSFARSQPTAFLGLAVLAGFGAIRFLKSSSSADQVGGQSSSQSSQNSYGNQNRGAARPGTNRYSSNADNRGYRDEFTK